MTSGQDLSGLFGADWTGDVATLCAASPASEGWKYVTFAAVEVAAGAVIEFDSAGQEIAIVPLSGRFDVAADGNTFPVTRSNVFDEAGSVVYIPPSQRIRITALTASTIAIGGAPAVARYPTRFIQAAEIRAELRGGGAARRQVAHLLAPPIEAHRLILYEVHVPRGSWSGWPPHCHDGQDGSPYLEETYYFEHQPSSGFAIHRNFRDATGYDETHVAPHQSVVTVPAGYHSSAACPGSHMYFLNYLAGDLEHEDRRTPPCFDERYTWIDGHWDDDPMTLPTAGRS
jgi:5-deoxy-glucuronate isomerase